jgi:hypothetical protein
MHAYEIVTAADLNAATAVFDSRAAAQAAADAAMPRRIHDRPYAQSSGWHWARAVACPDCGALAGADCAERLHRGREIAARAAGRAADRWIVCARSNVILLRDGSMYDHARGVTIAR